MDMYMYIQRGMFGLKRVFYEKMTEEETNENE